MRPFPVLILLASLLCLGSPARSAPVEVSLEAFVGSGGSGIVDLQPGDRLVITFTVETDVVGDPGVRPVIDELFYRDALLSLVVAVPERASSLELTSLPGTVNVVNDTPTIDGRTLDLLAFAPAVATGLFVTFQNDQGAMFDDANLPTAAFPFDRGTVGFLDDGHLAYSRRIYPKPVPEPRVGILLLAAMFWRAAARRGTGQVTAPAALSSRIWSMS